MLVCSFLATAIHSGAAATARAEGTDALRAPIGRAEAPPVDDPRLEAARRAVRRKDFVEAVRLWNETARAGSAEAAYRLGVSFRSGAGVERDARRARSWFERAAESGHAEARFALARMLRSGFGAEADRVRALELLGQAARSGHSGARVELARLSATGAAAYVGSDERVAMHRLDPREALAQAIRIGDVGAADEAIARGAPIDGAPGDTRHWRPLVLAVDRGAPDMVALLIARGADPNCRSRAGEPVLIRALVGGDVRIVRRLLEAGADPTSRAVGGYSALMVAVQYGRREAIGLLLAAGAPVDFGLADGTTAVEVAKRFGHASLANLLARKGAPGRASQTKRSDRRRVDDALTPSSPMPPLVSAAQRGDAAAVARLLSEGAEIGVRDAAGRHALGLASAGGSVEVVRALLDAGMAVDHPGPDATTALMQAMASSQPGASEVFRLLLEAGADVHARTGHGRGVIDFASKGATREKMTALAAAGGSWTPASMRDALEAAAGEGGTERIAALIEANHGRSAAPAALCRAIERARVETVLYLVAAEIPPDVKCRSRQPALVVAAISGQIELVTALLRAGAQVDATTPEGESALIAAASRGFVDAVDQLLAAGADVDHRGSAGATALMASASADHPQVVTRLLDAGANRSMRSDTDQTALDLARQAGAAEVVRRIESARSRGWSLWGDG